MKVTIDNYKKLIPEKDQMLIMALIIDLDELNNKLEDKQEPYRKLYIDYITEHTEYSSERIDPCPDYYGMYRLVFEKNIYETVGAEMTIDELDSALCILINFIEFN